MSFSPNWAPLNFASIQSKNKEIMLFFTVDTSKPSVTTRTTSTSKQSMHYWKIRGSALFDSVARLFDIYTTSCGVIHYKISYVYSIITTRKQFFRWCNLSVQENSDIAKLISLFLYALSKSNTFMTHVIVYQRAKQCRIIDFSHQTILIDDKSHVTEYRSFYI